VASGRPTPLPLRSTALVEEPTSRPARMPATGSCKEKRSVRNMVRFGMHRMPDYRRCSGSAFVPSKKMMTVEFDFSNRKNWTDAFGPSARCGVAGSFWRGSIHSGVLAITPHHWERGGRTLVLGGGSRAVRTFWRRVSEPFRDNWRGRESGRAWGLDSYKSRTNLNHRNWDN